MSYLKQSNILQIRTKFQYHTLIRTYTIIGEEKFSDDVKDYGIEIKNKHYRKVGPVQ